jgi:Tfp pilus assembly protein PilF
LTTLDALKNRLLGLTYNNLGCVAKQGSDFKKALEYLKKALVFESKLEEEQEEYIT